MLARERAEVWERIYRAHAEPLYVFAYRLCGDSHDAADLVQETLVSRVLPRIDEFDLESDLGPYLRTAARNLFVDSIRRGARVRVTADVPEPEVPTVLEDDPERALLSDEQRRALNAALADTTPAQRRVLALRELDQLSYRAIAEVVGVSEGTVTKRIFDARMSLRRRFRLRHVDLEAMPDPCRARLPRISRHIDGELAGQDLLELEEHLSACAFCRAARADMVDANRSYRAAIPPVIAVPGLLESLSEVTVASGSASASASGPAAGLARVGARKAVFGLSAVVSIIVAVVLVWPAGWQPIVSDFATGSAGWAISGDAGGAQRTPTFVASAGNPGGHVDAVDQVTGVTWFWRAPARYRGDVSPAYGRALTFDLKQASDENAFEDVDVVLRGAGRTLQFDLADDPGGDWTSYRVVLDESAGWRDAASGARVSAAVMRAVLGDVTDLLIRGEYSLGPDTGSLDNVVLGADR
jgi:RNA polymerase sigma-70 factor (ECF subfamily)